MSIEFSLKEMLELNGFKRKTTNTSFIFTYDHHLYGIVNYHNGYVWFNNLSKYMRNEVKKTYGKHMSLPQEDRKKFYINALSKLNFYKYIKDNIKIDPKKINGGTDYVGISENVGIEILGEIVKFIINYSDDKNFSINAENENVKKEMYPLIKSNVELAAAKVDLGKSGNIKEILNEFKNDADSAGKSLEDGWQGILLEKIPEWFKQS